MARACAAQSPPRVANAGPPPHVRGDRGAHDGPRVQHPGGGAVDAGSALLAAPRPARIGPALHAHHLGRGRLLLAPQPSRVPPAARGRGRNGGVLPRGLREPGRHRGRRGGSRPAGGHPGLRRLLHPPRGGARARPLAGPVGRRPRRRPGGRRVPPRLDDALRPEPGSRRAHRASGTAGVHGRRRRRQPASRPRPRPGLLGAAVGGPPARARPSRHARSPRGLAGHGRATRRRRLARRRHGAGGAGPGPAAPRVDGGAYRGLALRRPARQSRPARPRVSPRGYPVPDRAGRDHRHLSPGRVQQHGPAASDPRGRAGPRAGRAACAGGVARPPRPSPGGRAGGAGRGRGAGRARGPALGGCRPVGAAATGAARRGGGPGRGRRALDAGRRRGDVGGRLPRPAARDVDPAAGPRGGDRAQGDGPRRSPAGAGGGAGGGVRGPGGRGGAAAAQRPRRRVDSARLRTRGNRRRATPHGRLFRRRGACLLPAAPRRAPRRRAGHRRGARLAHPVQRVHPVRLGGDPGDPHAGAGERGVRRLLPHPPASRCWRAASSPPPTMSIRRS